MSLRARLFAAFGVLIGLVLLAQWLVIRHAKREIALEFGKAALALTEDISVTLSELANHDLHPPDLATGREILVKAADDDGVKEKEVALINEDVNYRHIEAPKAGADDEKRRMIVAEVSTTWAVGDPDDPSSPPKTKVLKKRIHYALDDPENAAFLYLNVEDENRKIALPSDGVTAAIHSLSNRQMVGSGLIFMLGLLAAAILAHRESRPLRALAGAAHRLGEGAWGTQIPQLGGGREMRQAVGAFNRMSARIETLNREAESHREARHLSELSDVAQGLAHTLRNPLNTLGLSLEELGAQSKNPAQSEKLVDQSRRQIRRIDRWIRSFLALASEGRGQIEPIDLNGLLGDIALETMQQDRVRVQLQIPPTLPRLTGVAPELRAVVQALVVNAVEASPKGGDVVVRARAGASEVEIEILDRGPGISDAIRERLFMPHQTTKVHGSGMGLYLAQRIATNRYDGELELLDRDGGGTHARLRLPLRNGYAEHQNPVG